MILISVVDFKRGNTAETKGTAFVVYEDIFDAKNACDHLSGFNVCNRYLVVLYYQPNKVCFWSSYRFCLNMTVFVCMSTSRCIIVVTLSALIIKLCKC